MAFLFVEGHPTESHQSGTEETFAIYSKQSVFPALSRAGSLLHLQDKSQRKGPPMGWLLTPRIPASWCLWPKLREKEGSTLKHICYSCSHQIFVTGTLE